MGGELTMDSGAHGVRIWGAGSCCNTLKTVAAVYINAAGMKIKTGGESFYEAGKIR